MKRWFAAALAIVGCLIVAFAYRARVPEARPPDQAATVLSGGVRTPVLSPVEGPRFANANVIVISIDTLRRDHLAPYGASFETVAASRLAREGVVFEHAVSQVPLTLPSHTSLFTGLYPPHHAVRDNGGIRGGGGRDHSGGAVPGTRLPDRGVRVVLRPPLSVGHRSGS